MKNEVYFDVKLKKRKKEKKKFLRLHLCIHSFDFTHILTHLHLIICVDMYILHEDASWSKRCQRGVTHVGLVVGAG